MSNNSAWAFANSTWWNGWIYIVISVLPGCMRPGIRVPVETGCNETVTETYNFVFRVAEPCDLDWEYNGVVCFDEIAFLCRFPWGSTPSGSGVALQEQQLLHSSSHLFQCLGAWWNAAPTGSMPDSVSVAGLRTAARGMRWSSSVWPVLAVLAAGHRCDLDIGLRRRLGTVITSRSALGAPLRYHSRGFLTLFIGTIMLPTIFYYSPLNLFPLSKFSSSLESLCIVL